jgi:hypothetical protein
MSGLIVSSTTDTPQQVQAALEHFGYSQESVETIETSAPTSAPETPASAEPPAGEPGEAADKSAAVPGAEEEIQEPEGTETPKKGKKAIEERFAELTRRRHEAERQADAHKAERDELKRKLAEYEAKPAEKPAEAKPEGEVAKPAEDEPVLDAFESYEEWVRAHQEWTAKRANAPLRAEIDALKAQIQAKDEEERLRREQQPVVEAWLDKVETAKAAHPDYDDMTRQAEQNGLVATPAMHQEIFESEQGPEILYYLASHPEECKRIEAATSVPEKPTPKQVGDAVRAAAREIGRIEAALSAPVTPEVPATPETPKPPKPSGAPPPVRPPGTKSGTPIKSPGEMSPAEYAQWRKDHPNG